MIRNSLYIFEIFWQLIAACKTVKVAIQLIKVSSALIPGNGNDSTFNPILCLRNIMLEINVNRNFLLHSNAFHGYQLRVQAKTCSICHNTEGVFLLTNEYLIM